MKLEIIEPNEKISDKDIEKIEQKYNLSFPVEYKNFMLKYNGGEPADLLFKPQEIQDHRLQVFEFYSLERLEEFLEVIKKEMASKEEFYMLMYQRYGKEKMIIIGEIGWNSSALCVCYSEKDYGKVYFINMNEVNDDEFHLLANNFDEFMNNFSSPFAHDFEEACEIGDYDKARKIFEKGIDFELKTYLNESILELALRYKLLDIIQEILKKSKPKGLIFMAMHSFDPKVLKFVLEIGCNVNEINSFGQTALFSNNRDDLIKILIEFGADVNIRDNYGKKAIDYCDPTISEYNKKTYNLLKNAEEKNN